MRTAPSGCQHACATPCALGRLLTWLQGGLQAGIPPLTLGGACRRLEIDGSDVDVRVDESLGYVMDMPNRCCPFLPLPPMTPDWLHATPAGLSPVDASHPPTRPLVQAEHMLPVFTLPCALQPRLRLMCTCLPISSPLAATAKLGLGSRHPTQSQASTEPGGIMRSARPKPAAS